MIDIVILSFLDIIFQRKSQLVTRYSSKTAKIVCVFFKKCRFI